jgi:hypothetical protein
MRIGYLLFATHLHHAGIRELASASLTAICSVGGLYQIPMVQNPYATVPRKYSATSVFVRAKCHCGRLSNIGNCHT